MSKTLNNKRNNNNTVEFHVKNETMTSNVTSGQNARKPVELEMKDGVLKINKLKFDFRSGKLLDGNAERGAIASVVIDLVRDLKFTLNRLSLRRKLRLPKDTLTMLKSEPQKQNTNKYEYVERSVQSTQAKIDKPVPIEKPKKQEKSDQKVLSSKQLKDIANDVQNSLLEILPPVTQNRYEQIIQAMECELRAYKESGHEQELSRAPFTLVNYSNTPQDVESLKDMLGRANTWVQKLEKYSKYLSSEMKQIDHVSGTYKSNYRLKDCEHESTQDETAKLAKLFREIQTVVRDIGGRLSYPEKLLKQFCQETEQQQLLDIGTEGDDVETLIKERNTKIRQIIDDIPNLPNECIYNPERNFDRETYLEIRDALAQRRQDIEIGSNYYKDGFIHTEHDLPLGWSSDKQFMGDLNKRVKAGYTRQDYKNDLQMGKDGISKFRTAYLTAKTKKKLTKAEQQQQKREREILNRYTKDEGSDQANSLAQWLADQDEIARQQESLITKVKRAFFG